MREHARIKKVKGEPFRYWVASENSKSWHLVDLTERGGQGACDCHDFQCRANPNWRRFGKHIPWGRVGRTDCKHIHVAKMKVDRDFNVSLRHACRNGVPPEVAELIRRICRLGNPGS